MFVVVVGFVGVLFAGELEPRWISDQDGSQWTGDVKSQPALPKNTIRMRRTFKLPNLPVRQAVAEMCGHGFAEFWVNGESADPRRRLSPAVCDYRKRALSAMYDVTALMRPGCNNTIGLWVSPGYSDDFSQHGWRWLRPKRAWGRLDITFADGSRQTVVTDDGWEWTDRTPIEAVSVYGGERYDASREDPDWCRPEGSIAAWKPVVCVKPIFCAKQAIVPERNPAPFVRTMETFRPISVCETDPGVWTVDFGQNMAGICEIRAKGVAGTCITLRHSENILADGSGRLDPCAQRKAEATDRFVLAGTGRWERYIPHFTYHGFRYVEVRGYPGRLTADDIAARAIHADVAYTAGFRSSDETLNWIFNAAKWTLLSNLLNYPSDCCDRDERTPCRGDSLKSEPSSMRFFGMSGFYEKWLDDIKHDGPAVPCTTGDIVILPWRFWELYGDKSQMVRHYGDMKRVALAFLEKYGGYIVEEGGYGDWCHPNDKTWKGYFCEPRALCSALIYKLLTTMRDVATVLGKDEDVRLWTDHAEKAKAEYLAKVYKAQTHVFGAGIQANYLLPLTVGLVPEKDHAAVVENLIGQIRKDGLKLTTGGLTTHLLVDVLCDEGQADLALHLLTQPAYPSPAYMRARGATTLWEQWYYDGNWMNAHSHLMFTGLGSSLLTRFAGIRSKKPGYAELEIRPACPTKLDFVEAWQQTPQGRVEVSWKRTAGGVDFAVTVPSGVPATLVLPDGTRRSLKPGLNKVAWKQGDGKGRER